MSRLLAAIIFLAWLVLLGSINTIDLFFEYTYQASEYTTGEFAKPVNRPDQSTQMEDPIQLGKGVAGDYQYAIMTSGIVLSAYTGTERHVVLPMEVKGEQVVGIGARMFAGSTTLQSIVIPEGYLSIGEAAFEGCTALTKVTVRGRIIEIPSRAFAECTALKDVSFNGAVENFESEAFYGCTSLKYMPLPKGAKRIGNRAFAKCTALELIDIPVNLRLIGTDAFVNTPWFINQKDEFVVVSRGILIKYNGTAQRVEVPSDVFYIANAFANNTTLQEVVLPPNLEEILPKAFEHCTALRRIDVPEGVVAVGYQAFSGCTSLEEAVIAPTVTSIGESTFRGCTSLKRVDIQAEIDKINANTFADCFRLKEARLPDTVVAIGDNAFSGCHVLSVINWPEALQTIGEGAFTRCFRLENVVLPQSVSLVGSSAFMNTGLRSIVLPAGAVEIQSQAFAGCKSLDWIETGKNTKAFADDALDEGARVVIGVVSESAMETWVRKMKYTYRYLDE